MTVHQLDCAGVTIAVHEFGEPDSAAPAVLALHGFTGDGPTMKPAVRGLHNRRILAPDLIGHGASSHPEQVADYTMEACLVQVNAALDHLGVEVVDLLGYSMGARVALSMLVGLPERVRNVALVGGTPGLRSEDDRAARRAADGELADFIETEGIEAFVDRWMGLPIFASQQRLGPAALTAGRRQRLGNDPAGLAKSLRGMGTGSMPPLFEDLPQVSSPVWWIHGEEDQKFAAIANAAAASMADARVCSIPAAGHAAHLENPAAVAATVTIALNPPRFPS